MSGVKLDRQEPAGIREITRRICLFSVDPGNGNRVLYSATHVSGKLRTRVTCGPPSPQRGLADLTVAINVDAMGTLPQMSIQSMLPLAEHLPRPAKSSLPPTMGRYGLSTICRRAAQSQ